jgi:hypothetical protein
MSNLHQTSRICTGGPLSSLRRILQIRCANCTFEATCAPPAARGTMWSIDLDSGSGYLSRASTFLWHMPHRQPSRWQISRKSITSHAAFSLRALRLRLCSLTTPGWDAFHLLIFARNRSGFASLHTFAAAFFCGRWLAAYLLFRLRTLAANLGSVTRRSRFAALIASALCRYHDLRPARTLSTLADRHFLVLASALSGWARLYLACDAKLASRFTIRSSASLLRRQVRHLAVSPSLFPRHYLYSDGGCSVLQLVHFLGSNALGLGRLTVFRSSRCLRFMQSLHCLRYPSGLLRTGPKHVIGRTNSHAEQRFSVLIPSIATILAEVA